MSHLSRFFVGAWRLYGVVTQAAFYRIGGKHGASDGYVSVHLASLVQLNDTFVEDTSL